MNLKKIIGGGLALAVVIGGIVLGVNWWQDRSHYASLVAAPKDVTKWEADPRPLQSKQAALDQLKTIKQVDGKGMDPKNVQSIVIPGLRGAWSIDHKTKKAAFSTDWVPQGVTQSDTHYYFSAYDGDKKLNSVIFQVDKKTGKYVKTLILKSKAHVGGIAYDNARKRLFFSDDSSKKGAGFGWVDQGTIDGYDAKVAKAPLATHKIQWSLGTRTSAIALFEDQMIVVKYGQNKADRSVVAVPLDQNGLPEAFTVADLTALTNKLIGKLEKDDFATAITKEWMETLIAEDIITAYAPGWDRLQGVAVAKNGITLLSQSNGKKPGKVYVQVAAGTGWSNLSFIGDNDGKNLIKVPNSVEQVSLNQAEDQFAMIFESGARKYREDGNFMKRPSFMDRVLILPIDTNPGK